MELSRSCHHDSDAGLKVMTSSPFPTVLARDCVCYAESDVKATIVNVSMLRHLGILQLKP